MAGMRVGKHTRTIPLRHLEAYDALGWTDPCEIASMCSICKTFLLQITVERIAKLLDTSCQIHRQRRLLSMVQLAIYSGSYIGRVATCMAVSGE